MSAIPAGRHRGFWWRGAARHAPAVRVVGRALVPRAGPREAARADERPWGRSVSPRDGHVPAGVSIASAWGWFGDISPASRWSGPQKSLSHAACPNCFSPLLGPWISRLSVHSGLPGGLILLLVLLVAGTLPGSGLCTPPSRSPWIWGGNGHPTPQNVLFQPSLPHFPVPPAVLLAAGTAAGQTQRLQSWFTEELSKFLDFLTHCCALCRCHHAAPAAPGCVTLVPPGKGRRPPELAATLMRGCSAVSRRRLQLLRVV